ncbi:MAG: putative immunity protein [Deltaproteobacteria bacterium]
MTSNASKVALSEDDLRAVAGYAADCAQVVLEIYEQAHPGDLRPREAIDAARAFARAGARGNPLRDAAWAAHKAAREAKTPAANEAARAAMLAASAAYLHPLADAHQVKHILGAAAHAARATEILGGDDREVAVKQLAEARQYASAAVVAVLVRYPRAPSGGGRVGELLRVLDTALRCS